MPDHLASEKIPESRNSSSLSDITAGKHKCNPKSVAANKRVQEHKASGREQIRVQIASAGFAGLTINEVKIWDERKQRYKPANELSLRLTELKALALIFDSHRSRVGCTVYVGRPEFVAPKGTAHE